MVVVRPEYSKTTLLTNPEVIDDISRVEVLINQPCMHECPKMPEHYKFLESFRVGNKLPEKPFQCARDILKGGMALVNTVCHSEELVKQLIKHGVKHLKLQGRGSDATYNQIALMLYNQMFRIDGPYYIVAQELLYGQFNKYINHFLNEILRLKKSPI
jgi:hypothetical protein